MIQSNRYLLVMHLFIFLILPATLISQELNSFVEADTTIEVQELVIQEFGEELSNLLSFDTIGNPYRPGILEVKNLLESKVNKNNNSQSRFIAICQCQMDSGKITLTQSIGFMSGLAIITEINLTDSTYFSIMAHHTDGVKVHKFFPEEEFIADIEVPLNETTLVLSPNLKFSDGSSITGKLTGTSQTYLEHAYTGKGYTEVQDRVVSVFECKLEDWENIRLQMEKRK